MLKEESIKKSMIDMMVSAKRNIEDKYILDDENAIIVVAVNDLLDYIMIHEKLVDGKLLEINRWPISGYHYDSDHDEIVIKDLGLFKVQYVAGHFKSLYNYKEGKFVVPQRTWGVIESGYGNSVLKKYNGFLGTFIVRSDDEEDDVCDYFNLMTGEKIFESFSVIDGNYYAIIDVDGTIRGNKLFKGNSFSKITEIIDLDKYESLDEFKSERRQLCNNQKQKRKQAYYQLLENRNDGSISPYLDSEVAKVLNIKL